MKIDIHSRDDIDPWLRSAHPGQKACYFVGHLAEHRCFTIGHDRVERLAHALQRLASVGKVHLVQERCRGGFRYLVIKAHRKQTAMEMVREEREPVERFQRKYDSFGPKGHEIIDLHKSNPRLSNATIASRTGSTYGAVSVALSRARKAGIL